jgi:hypothetical protein
MVTLARDACDKVGWTYGIEFTFASFVPAPKGPSGMEIRRERERRRKRKGPSPLIAMAGTK